MKMSENLLCSLSWPYLPNNVPASSTPPAKELGACLSGPLCKHTCTQQIVSRSGARLQTDARDTARAHEEQRAAGQGNEGPLMHGAEESSEGKVPEGCGQRELLFIKQKNKTL